MRPKTLFTKKQIFKSFELLKIDPTTWEKEFAIIKRKADAGEGLWASFVVVDDSKENPTPELPPEWGPVSP
jgi:hypothetical protein